MPSTTKTSTAQRILDELEPLLGRHTSRKAMDLVLERLGKSDAEVTTDDLASVHDALLPMLRQLVGRHAAERALERITAPDGNVGASE